MGDLISDLTSVLKFYKSLGFESIPSTPLDSKSDGSSIEQNSLDNYTKDETHSINERITAYMVTTQDKSESLSLLRQEIGDCKRCRLSEGRNNIVFGEGNVNTRIMFIGEGPGRDEDLQGRPFVGKAGDILTSLINKMGKEIGFERKDVFIANVVKCRPPMNRDPMPDEIETCLPFLNRQIEIIMPEIIMSLGRISTHTLMGLKTPLNKFSISEARGKIFEYKIGNFSIPVMPTFHPAYFLRNAKDKHLTWSDAMAVIDKLRSARSK
jgi:DNA polymerase